MTIAKRISKCSIVQIVGTSVDVKEAGPDVVIIVVKMDIAAIKMDADHALKKWPNFLRIIRNVA